MGGLSIIPSLAILSCSYTFFALGQEVIAPYQSNDTLVYLQGVNVVVRNESPKPTSLKLVDGATVTSSSSANGTIVTIKYPDQSNTTMSVSGFSLELTFAKDNGYWALSDSKMSSSVEVTGDKPVSLKYTDEKVIPQMELAAPLSMSFHCGRFGPFSPVLDRKRPNATVAVELIDFQFQTFMKDSSKFGRSYDCVGFFSIGILSGWFITIILLGILTLGIKGLMSIHTMDRFDDSKGKTITINATD